MTEEDLKEKYFIWMCGLIEDEWYTGRRSYDKLLRHLADTDFTYTIPMDGNREADGIDLRYRFGYENDIPDAAVATYLDNRPCSVLEMMVALSLRCGEQLMDGQTGKWFWAMVKNLELDGMDDISYRGTYVERRIDSFLGREYGKDGTGGLFTVRHPDKDMRREEIWGQMCWYLAERSAREVDI